MRLKPIIIVPGQPNSIFFEIFFKSLNIKRIKSPIILICCADLFRSNAKKYKYNESINLIDSINKKKKLNKKFYLHFRY